MIRAPTGWLIHGSFLIGLLFAVLPLPAMLQPLRPYLLAMLVAYWVMEAPARVGFGTAFILGVLADLMTASILGEQAFRLVVIAWLVQHFRTRLRFFPLWQQAAAVGLLLFNDRLIGWLIHLFAGAQPLGLASWLSPLLAMLLWPWLYVLIDMARLRARERG
jgi:rod shape-determining protein MreD